jgi:hypothetical protein
MRRANYRVVLDACVLANHGVCDLFLRLAERPRLYSAIWSQGILEETFNLRDFSSTSLEPWGIQAVHPADYLITLHTIAPDVVVAKLGEMVRDRQIKDPGLTPQGYLAKLARSVPAFAAHVADLLGWSLDS